MTMRTVTLPGTDLEGSCLGFGCASLGSRIGRSAGMRALAEAYAAGVTWYDVAPPYGAGEAEPILGEFLHSRRDHVRICTKVGLLGPQRHGLTKLVYALARPVAGRIKALRRRFRAVPATRYRRAVLDAATIKASLENSLLRLRTDHVDVFALHDPTPEDVTRDEVLRALEDLLTSGKARYLSVAGTAPACMAGLAPGLPYRLAQLADDPCERTLASLRQGAPHAAAFVTHSVFGVDGMLDRLTAMLDADADARERLSEAGYRGSVSRMAAALLIDRAFASNPDGVVLTSMFAANHRALNLSRAVLSPRPKALRLLASVLDGAETR